jgi:hypothetical protein
MRKLPRALLTVLVIAAAGFAAASIVSGKSLADVITGTNGTTTGATTTGTTTTGQGARKVTICHLTGSKHHPAVTISVSQSAVAAHLRHGDHLGACTGTETQKPKHSSGSTTGTTGSSTTTTTTSSHGNSGSNGNGNGNNGNGNSGHASSGHGNNK